MEVCFAKKANLSCGALTYKKCTGCKFYRSASDNTESLKLASQRLAGLPAEERSYIMQKYYPDQGVYEI